MQTNIEGLSYRFALRIIQLNESLENQRRFVLSRQILRSGTAIGALTAEAQYAQSKPDFISKLQIALQIALKEANETRYWLKLLYDSEYIEEDLFTSLLSELESILRVLTRIINTSKKRLK
ncbi:four helix bundle protein [Nitratifractor sp.]|uniref:four helix bundle protein n=1 Tax=Nitratifractor sp. TaxID=2268144 RepID=UPI0025E8E1AA|nr:four helix bundle protein [Nitratifractor sp.]